MFGKRHHGYFLFRNSEDCVESPDDDKMSGAGTTGRDAVLFDPRKRYTSESLILFDIRRYLKVIVALNAVFVLTLLICFAVVWSQISKYDLVKTQNMNLLNDKIQTITQNVAVMTTLATPIVGNLQFATNAMAAALAGGVNASLVNATSVAARAEGTSQASRRLQQMGFDASAPAVKNEITEQDLMVEEYNIQHMMYKETRKLLQTINAKTQEFDPSSVSNLLDWIVGGVNYTSIAQRFDRVMSDAETASSFMALSMEAVSAVALARGINLTAVSDAVLKSARPSASPQAVASTCAQ